MGRILFFVLLAVALYLVWRALQRRDRTPRSPPNADTPQVMVSCATCGLHVPRREALLLGDRYFCCEEHRRNAPGA
jgi:uncharacterized protein